MLDWILSDNVHDLGTALLVRAVCACLISFVLTLALGGKIIRGLVAMKLGQPFRTAAEVHKLAELHSFKEGTPTMGGVMILGGTVVATLLCAKLDNAFVWVTLFAMLALGMLGFRDDYLKIKKRTADGLSARGKLLVQMLVGIACMSVLYFYPECSPCKVEMRDYISQVFVPFYGSVHLGWLILPFGVVVLMSASNAVNLTDGVDGLAAGCSVSSGIVYSLIAVAAGSVTISTEVLQIPHHPGVGELAVMLMGMVGACLGFLWYNCHPASVFMGDTGALGLGGALGMVAICTAQELVFVVVAGVFVLDAFSVVLQVGSYKLRNKKRIFRMAPIHHHFELGGWKETQVIVRFWMASFLLGIVGLALLKSV